MSRSYRQYCSPDEIASVIASEVILQQVSTGWAGDIEDKEQVEAILKPYNIVYTDDMFGEWALKK